MNRLTEPRDMTDDECRYWLDREAFGETANETVTFQGIATDFVVVVAISDAPTCIAAQVPTAGFLPLPAPKLIYFGTLQREAAQVAQQAWIDHMTANFCDDF